MSTTLNETMDTARDALDLAKESTGHAVSSARSTLLEGVKTVTGIVAMLRDLEVGDALGWVGLSRRQSPLRGVAIFGAGVALGAGVGVLFAPMSGGDLRRAMLRTLHGATDEVKKEARAVSERAEAATRTLKDAAKAHGSPSNGDARRAA
jgi:hypothetical protein